MKIKYYSLAGVIMMAFLLANCVSKPAAQPETTVTPLATVAAQAQPTQTATITPTAIPLPTIQPDCIDSALYIEDVTIPDNTRFKPGEAFIKTWRLRNTGTCIWNIRYALIFVGGEQMSAPVTTPLSETNPGDTLDISVNLVAPATDGMYTGLYELRNPKGKALAIGSVTSIWVKIAVGNVVLPLAYAPVTQSPGTGKVIATAPAPNTPCNPQKNSGYIQSILSLINKARTEARLTVLNFNTQLSAAAQAHSDDMACNNFTGHTGSDGSSIHARVAAAGYASSYSVEIIYPGGAPQDAFNWWINDKIHRDAILNPNVVDVGIGYTYLPGTVYGSYYTVDFATH